MKFKGFLFVLCMCTCLQAKKLIWDFGGVIFRPSYLGVGLDVGPQYFLKYMLMDMKSPNIQSELFKFLDTMMKDDNKFGPVGSGDGTVLPTIMRHWQAGTILGPDIIKMSKEHIERMDKIGYFGSTYEKELFQRVIETMFNPKILAKNIYPVPAGIKLLKKCVAAKNPDGTKMNDNYGWSNMDELSYALSKKLYPHIFALFDGEFISGRRNVVKPDKDFFELGLQEFQLDSKECLLIDDQEVNAKGARDCNIRTIVLKDWNYKELKRQLIAHGALNSRIGR